MRGSEPMPVRTFSMSAPSALGEVRELVHEADLGREHRVRRVLRQLRRAQVHHDHALVIAGERVVERLQQFRGARIVGADDHAVRLHEVRDRRALLQEFGIRDDVELDAARRARSASRRPSALTLSEVPTGTVDLVMTTLYSAMCSPIVRATASTWRRSAEPSSSGGVPTAIIWNRPCATAALASVVKVSRPLLAIARDQLIEARLVDRHLARIQPRDLGRVDVDADDLVAGIRQAGAGDEADIARAEDRDTQDRGLIFFGKVTRRLTEGRVAVKSGPVANVKLVASLLCQAAPGGSFCVRCSARTATFESGSSGAPVFPGRCAYTRSWIIGER